MTPQYDPSDGVSQLTEIMSHERIPEERQPAPPVDPDIRRKRRRTGLIVGGIAAVFLIIFVASYIGYTLNAPVGAAAATSQVPEVPVGAAAEIALSPEGESAVSILGAEDYLGEDAAGIWMASGGNDSLPIASISKLITAMVILDAKPLKSHDGPTITFGKADHALYDKYYVMGATIASMPTGSTMSERDALKMLLVPSASNYAEAVAGWAFGSQGGFVDAAAGWLADKGLKHTKIVEPTGIDARNTSRPTDLIKLARLAMADPDISAMVALPRLDIPGFEQMPNTNDLLGTGGVSGIKTGTLESSSNLLFTAQLPIGASEPLTVIGVVLGGFSHESVNLDVTALLSSIAVGFHTVDLAEQGQEVGTYTTAWGESARMVLAGGPSLFTWSDTPITATIDTTTLTTGAKGEKVGSVTWTAGPNTVEVSVILDGTIDPPSEWWRLTHPFELG